MTDRAPDEADMDASGMDATGEDAADVDIPSESPGLSRRRFLGLAGAAGLSAAMGPRATARLFSGTAAAGTRAAAHDASSAGLFSDAELAASETAEAGKVTLAQLKKDLGFDPKFLGKGETYDIGAILPLTGTGSFYGIVMTDGIDLGVKHVKALGGPTFKMNIKDNKSGTAVAGVSALRELHGTGIDMFVSSYIADEYALLPGIQQYKMFALEVGQGTPTKQTSGIPYYWAGIQGSAAIDPLLFKYLSVKFPKMKKVAAVSIELGTTIDEEGAAIGKHWANHFGMDIVDTLYTPYGTTDFSSMLSTLKGLDFDGLSMGISPGAGLFMNQYVAAGFKQPCFCGNLLPSDVAVGKGNMTGLILAALTFDPTSAQLSPWGRFFRTAYYGAYGKKPLYPEAYGTTAYTIMFQFWQLIQAAHKHKLPVNSNTLNKLAAKTTVKSVFGGTPNKIASWHWDKTHYPTGEDLGVYILTGTKQSLKQVAAASATGVTLRGFRLFA